LSLSLIFARDAVAPIGGQSKKTVNVPSVPGFSRPGFPPSVPVPANLPAQSPSGCPACGQVEKALEDFGHLKAGMLRRDAEQYFVLDGGMNFRGQTRYVYGRCEFIQVEISFEEDPDVKNDFSPKDKIASLSTLFLAFPSKDWLPAINAAAVSRMRTKKENGERFTAPRSLLL